jgi:hypothetical protein
MTLFLSNSPCIYLILCPVAKYLSLNLNLLSIKLGGEGEVIIVWVNVANCFDKQPPHLSILTPRFVSCSGCQCTVGQWRWGVPCSHSGICAPATLSQSSLGPQKSPLTPEQLTIKLRKGRMKTVHCTESPQPKTASLASIRFPLTRESWGPS